MNIVQPGLLAHNCNHSRKKAEAGELLRVGVSNQDGQDPIWEMLSLKPWDEWLMCLFNIPKWTGHWVLPHPSVPDCTLYPSVWCALLPEVLLNAIQLFWLPAPHPFYLFYIFGLFALVTAAAPGFLSPSLPLSWFLTWLRVLSPLDSPRCLYLRLCSPFIYSNLLLHQV